MIRAIYLLCILTSLMFFWGCQRKDKSPVAIEIDSIHISAQEFEEAFMRSTYAKEDTLESRKEFLDEFIVRKLILDSAHSQGLDRDPLFLSDVEAFWQQSLIKLMLDRKIKELSTEVSVDDSEVRNLYNEYEHNFEGKPLEEVYQQIKWMLLQEKQQAAISRWIDSLKSSSKITVHEDVLTYD